MSGKTRIICIIGPTASGKSAKAVALAKEYDGEVISVDSRQVYNTLDIGTEKISAEEMQEIPHHLIDIKDPKDPYSAGDFVVDATRLIKEITARGKVPILAGGSHFYIDALLFGIPEQTPPDEDLRATLEQKPTEELFAEIQKLDPRRASEIDSQNRRRLIRALEIIHKRGAVPVRTRNTEYEVEWHTLLPKREELRKRLEARLQTALDRGLIGEVQRIRAYVGDERLNELGLEYRIIGDYLRGDLKEEALIPTLNAKLFRYARRQEAWIRKLHATYIQS